MEKFPPWLPAEVKEHSKRLVEIGGLNTAKPLLMRLVTNPEMQKVWTGLSPKTTDPQELIDFLEYVRLHPALMGNPADSIEVPSDKVQRNAFKKVGNASQQIIEVLSSLSSDDDPQHGWCLLESALIRSELHEVEQTLKDRVLDIKRLRSHLNELQQQGSVIELLETIVLASNLASAAPDAAMPKRRNSDRAKCNQLVLDLKRYLKHHFYTQSPALIAATVNAAFDLPDGGISADDVRKLKS